MERQIIVAKDTFETITNEHGTKEYVLKKTMQQILDEVNAMMSKDEPDCWYLDGSAYVSAGRGQPMRVEGVGVVYHLVKYTAEELEKIKEQLQQEETDANDPLKRLGARVTDAQQLPWGEKVQELLKKGYRIVDKWKDYALLYLYEGDEIVSKEQEPEPNDDRDSNQAA